ncbi:HAMP domain-containing histidine kinase [Clostridiaceae bacterium NSJ-31]|uniref:histidine kinase n=1 Tax=Ligaoa zhengdingensis TaxID=2763658 RepID=A0A926E032_9FIRM|nr:HAMP domain-containing sensor histidine kinase [Ligaoa zhengdingensis]MBC8546614.1 HAMP domain-containing histidine kinase [Ligaoa zhengdingensis]
MRRKRFRPSIRRKLTTTILGVFLANFLLLGGYYLHLISARLPEALSELQIRMGNQIYRRMLIAEILLLAVVLLVVTLVIYWDVVRPVEALGGEMDAFRRGVTPQPTDRSDEIGELHNRFVQLASDLERERQTQNRIIASISHDIKTPLTSVMGYAERLQKNGLSPERTERYLRTIYEKSMDIRELIEEFDDYLSCNLQSALKLQFLTSDELCALFEADCRDELEQEGVLLTVRNECPGEKLCADLSKLRRVFGNLIVNSLKHFDKAERRIELVCRRQEGGGVQLRLCDNGSGVPGDDLERIFEPLYTSDAGRSVAGLGLAICREIIAVHGGRIWAENRPEGGLCVCFTLAKLS